MDFFVQKIEIRNFKNIARAELEFSEKINCFTGLNGAGKTNLLDAIYFLSFTKSFFNSTDNQLIRYGEADFFIKGNFRKKEKNEEVSVYFGKGSNKIVKLNGKKYKRFSDHIGKFPVVFISPLDVDLIYGTSEIRRKFADIIISQLNPAYLQNLIRYKRALLQRNQLLKEFAIKKFFDEIFLESFDRKFVQLSEEIFKQRQKFIDEFNKYFLNYYNLISPENEQVSIEYKSHLKEKDYRELLKENQAKDLALQYTTSGIHRDDFVFRINEYPIKKHGSSGQQKTFVIALKFAQAKFIAETAQFNPILMLDDIFDKLDKERVGKIAELITDSEFGQIFITHTNLENLNHIINPATPAKRFKVENGNYFEI